MPHNYRLIDLTALIPHAVFHGEEVLGFDRIATDSRLIADGQRTCFFALVGERHNGHHYLMAAYEAGVRSFVVSALPESRPPHCAYLLTADTTLALQQIAAHHRHRFDIPVIGITGSNGKTIVKEWLSQLLADDFAVVRNPRSYNSQVGVPLSVWNMSESDTLGIFEAGISQPGEMARLQRVIAPTLGVFTHFGQAHRQNFNNDEHRAHEKCLLFSACHTVFFNAADEHVNNALDTVSFTGTRLTWSCDNPRADVWLERTEFNGPSVLHYGTTTFTATLPFSDPGSVSNLLCCVLVMCTLGVEPHDIDRRLKRLRSGEMRLERSVGRYGTSLISDVWNNDLHALDLALHELGKEHNARRKIVILSEIQQSGRTSAALCREVNSLLVQHGVDLLLGVGQTFIDHASAFSLEATCYATTEDLLNDLNEQLLAASAILVKGASDFRFDRVVRQLQLMAHPSVLEINMSRVVGNLNFYRGRVAHNVKMMAMVKAFGYGTGGYELASLLEFNRVDYLGVAYVHEGVSLRERGIRTGIFVLNPDVSAMPALIAHHLEPEIYSLRVLRALLDELAVAVPDAPYPIHLKIDTGMHRLGFTEHDLGEALSLIGASSALIRVAGVLSHFSAADRPDADDFSRQQIGRFEAASERIAAALGYTPVRHLCNTAGMLRFPEAHFDMVRLGIGLYGVPSCDLDAGHILPAGSLKTRISQLRTVEAGVGVGYGREGQSDHVRTIATVPVGYADGYLRALGNGKGYALLNGHPVYTAGRVCMDMTMFDVTGVECSEGDELLLFGDRPTLTEVATAAGTISYEVIAGVSQRVHRIFIFE